MDTDKKISYTDAQLAEFGEVISLNSIIMTEWSKRPRSNSYHVSCSSYEVHVLMLIREHPNITSIELSKKIGRTKSTISTLVFKLCSAGLITKEINPKNRREHFLNLTELGENLCDEHYAQDVLVMRQALERMLKHCTLEEFEAFIHVTKIRNEMYSDHMDEIVQDISLLLNEK